MNPFADPEDSMNPFEETVSPLDSTNPFAEPSSPVHKPKTPSPAKVPTVSPVKTRAKLEPLFRQTPLHMAIENRHREVVDIFLKYKGKFPVFLMLVRLIAKQNDL